MGLWATEIYVKSDDATAIATALTDIAALDDYRPCQAPDPAFMKARAQRKTYHSFTNEPLWGVMIFHTGTQWSYLRMNPFYLMCERPRGAQRPRLAELAKRLDCECFQLHVDDGCSVLLMECSATGVVVISGDTYDMAASGAAPVDGFYPFFAERIPEGDFRAGFRLLNTCFPYNSIVQTDDCESIPQQLATRLLNVPTEVWDENWVWAHPFYSHPLPNADITTLYFANPDQPRNP